MRGTTSDGITETFKPTPLTDKEFKAMVIQQEKERQEWYDTLDNRVVEAKLYHYRGVRNGSTKTLESYLVGANARSIYTPDINLDAYGTAIVVGTDRQRVMDNTFSKVTGIYSLNLTAKMLKAYEENNNNLIIQKQF